MSLGGRGALVRAPPIGVPSCVATAVPPVSQAIRRHGRTGVLPGSDLLRPRSKRFDRFARQLTNVPGAKVPELHVPERGAPEEHHGMADRRAHPLDLSLAA